MEGLEVVDDVYGCGELADEFRVEFFEVDVEGSYFDYGELGGWREWMIGFSDRVPCWWFDIEVDEFEKGESTHMFPSNDLE